MTEPTKWRRRSWCLGSAMTGAMLASTPGRALAGPPSKAELERRRLANRQELWHTYARNNASLVARYHVTRWSSLLREPLVADGTLAARDGEALVLRDEGFGGARTYLSSGHSSYGARNSEAPPRRIEHVDAPAVAWLAGRLLAIFGAGGPDSLTQGCATDVPRGRTPRLELRPPTDHPAREQLRGVTLTLDPVGGAVVRVEIAESQGDRIRYDLSDHRQQVNTRELDGLLGDGDGAP